MPTLKDHLAYGTVAAALAVAISTAAVNLKAPVVEKPISVVEASKHAWPALSDDEKAALTAQNRAGKAGDVDLFHYKCPHCHDYHLTRRPQQEA